MVEEEATAVLRRQLSSLILVLGLLSAAVLSAHLHATATADTTGWFGNAPSITRIGVTDKAAAQRQDPTGCTSMTVPVVRNILNQVVVNTETRCMVQTSEGLVDSFLAVYQPNGFTKAYPVTFSVPGSVVVNPIPDYPGALLTRSDPTYPGVDMGLYKDIGRHLQFNNSLLHPGFMLSDEPDLYFKYPNGRNMSFDTYDSLSFANGGTYLVAEAVSYGFVRINLTTLDMTTFAANTPVNSARQPLGASTAVSPSGRFATIAYTAPGGWGTPYFKLVDVDACDDASDSSASIAGCTTADYWPALEQAIPGLVAISGVAFANDTSLNFVATTRQGTALAYTRYELTAAGEPAHLEQYLALGDSYASGEGTFDYTAGTDALPNKCHLSALSYPFLMSARAGTTQSVACSGAIIDNVLGDEGGHKDNQLKDVSDTDITQSQKDQAYDQHTPGVIAQDRFVYQDKPKVVTISIGGNDVGFADIIARCILPFSPEFSGSQVTGASGSQDCYATYEDRLELVNTVNAQFNNLVQTYAKLQAGDPTRRVYVIGYPQIVKPDGDCALNVRLGRQETEFAYLFIGYLDSVIERAAARAGAVYVDTQHAFDGHRLCEAGGSQVAVNGLTAGDDKFVLFGNESYHPNQLGHQLLADAILAATHNLTDPMPAPNTGITPPVADDSLPLLQAPKVNRTAYTVLNVLDAPLQVLQPGVPFRVDVPSVDDILAPNSDFQAVLHSDPLRLGTIRSDAVGNITGDVAVPANAAPGIHVLHLYGKNIAGDLVDVQLTAYVAAGADDADGDGIPDGQDRCRYVPAAGVDNDQDGIDDACDSLITNPPAVLSTGSAGTASGNRTATASAAAISPPQQTGAGAGVVAAADDATASATSKQVLGAQTPALHEAAQAQPSVSNIAHKLVWWVWPAGTVGALSILSAVFFIYRNVRWHRAR
ncbi:MAG TPA: SGNH/GDSL hydrolase family protein [Candidatus Saccharimonadales bacterium]|nr:SGNH/GDSL hydrolase family protein [Candidatus Saccharimonadales bacterium]